VTTGPSRDAVLPLRRRGTCADGPGQRRPALVYDGDCGFCRRCAEWARRRLLPGSDVVPWQELPHLGALGLTVPDVVSASYWIGADGRAHRGERGVAMALIEIGGPWAVVGRVLLLPPIPSIAALVYRFIARNRHRLPGGTAACYVDDEDGDARPPTGAR